MKIDLDKLQEKIDQGIIKKQSYPELNIHILNYTPECQFSKKWDSLSLMCRGLVISDEGEIIARPFDKFFNLGEGVLPYEEGENLETLKKKHGSFRVYDKLDGSLGIVYHFGGKWHLSTRGSYFSAQAKKGVEILDNFKNFNGNRVLTHLFEIIYPENRIVVDYKGEQKLVYLGSRDPETGEEVVDGFCATNFDMPEQSPEIGEEKENSEGYVLVFDDGFRVKVKFEEYKRLHALLTELSIKKLWEMLRMGKPMNKIIEAVPDEFYEWVKKHTKVMQDQYLEIKEYVDKNVDELKNLEIGYGVNTEIVTYSTYQDFRQFLFKVYNKYISEHDIKYRDIILLALNTQSKEPVKQAIWDKIKPNNNLVFMNDET